MVALKFLRRQLASVIAWKPQDPDILLWKYPALTDELKNASKIIVAPGQSCILVYEGQITGVLDTPGTYNLKTSNHPFITSMLKVAQFFESEHKVYLYFYRKAEVVNQGWGTASPIKYVDSVYNIPIQLSAYGNFSYRLTDASMFYTEYAGSAEQYTTRDFQDLIQGRIIQLLATHFSEKKPPYTEIDAQLHALAVSVKEQLNGVFETVGVALTDFRIEGNSFDEETERRIGAVADVTADSKAAQEAGLTFMELEKLRALRDAAKNEGGMAGAGVGLGAAITMGKLFTDAVNEEMQPKTDEDTVKALKRLKLLLEEELITQAEYEEKRKQLLDQL
ncbi:SPFH domain-containing protein [Sphingobacterium gobiense]|uniref:SPFH domain-containing protein n=1 Tax=Sphingobacterium gobiense TaxID=1382456 RepID=A0A2S9JV24_9SPHI|nr:SPFH domain-containing protein [Sphingobacterium gobiense]PRD57093.1 hypothetical protein C5749_07770 [Sphingobacterium gobiense]